MRRHLKSKLRAESLVFIGAALLLGVGVPILLFSRGIFSDMSSQVVITEVEPAASAIPFTKLTDGMQSVVAKRVNYLLTSPSELRELWKIIEANGHPPAVDFKTQAVLAVFAGKEPVSSITVARIEDSDARLVSVVITKPDRPCTKVPSLESPYEIVAVPATTLPLKHEDLSVTESCPK